MADNKKKELHRIFIDMREDKHEDVFIELFSKYNDFVYKIAFSFLKNRQLSEDIKKTVFEKIWKLKGDFLPTKNEYSWLYTFTKNETFNYIRREGDVADLDKIYYISDEDKSLNEIVKKDKYNKIISKSSRKEREVASLKIIGGLSFDEISYIFGESILNVEWRYYKAVHTLEILIGSSTMFVLLISLFIAKMIKSGISSFRAYDIITLVASGIFLATAIIFGVIFFKYQEKLNGGKFKTAKTEEDNKKAEVEEK